MRYLLIDMANTFYRARFSAHRTANIEEKVSFAIHLAVASINKAWRDQSADHVICCFEGRSWRKDFYAPYKAQRAAARSAKTLNEKAEDELFWEALENIKSFFSNHTNCTVLQNNVLEADDLIAGWIQHHPMDYHTIISSDTDFYQLLSENVNQYNGISDELHTLNGIYDKYGKLVIDKKTKEPKKIPDPKYLLFEKIIRGDSSDNIFSAYPGVRTKGTKNKVGLIDAYEDRHIKGYAWNNLMLQRFCDHNGNEHRVLDDYLRNETLIDLTQQPIEIRKQITDTIMEATPKNISQIGVYFLKFCGKYELIKLSEYSTEYAKWLSSSRPAVGTMPPSII